MNKNVLKSEFIKNKNEIKDNILRLSVSKAKVFKDCQAKYKFQYIEKLPKKDWDFHVFGKFLHEILENFHKKIIDGDETPNDKLINSCYADALENWKDKVTPEQLLESKDIINSYINVLEDQKRKGIAPTVIAVEKEFCIDIDGKVLLNGFIDRIQIDHDGVIHVSDYKTTKNKKYLKDFFQLLTYAFALCLEDPSLQRVRTSFICLRHNCDSLVKEFTRDEIMEVESKFLDWASEINAEKLWRPLPSNLCKFCDYLAVCKSGTDFVNSNGNPKTINKFGKSDW